MAIIADGEIDNTGWSTVYAFNAYMYLILLILTAGMLLCVLIPGIPPQAILCPVVCTMCSGVPVLAGAIMAAVRRNSV